MTDYLTVPEAIAIHQILIRKFGGSDGIRDMGALESAMMRPQTGYYDDLIFEAAALFESLAINHPFIDGNKRVAFAVVDTFLRINGLRINQTSAEIYSRMIEMFETGTFTLSNLEPWLRRITKPIK
ncbi:MAG: type II toxin-antitoxin system death-on-curing family toxin [Actinobacteria bacterium]|nr:type II toxin-antitoxin system death-on-curing family toxin [Actinomycetota bacterium]NBY14956.1 type II toxin-antitoxin system death-on-curing family toxin [Actinomycetota bacterium]